MLFLNIVLLLCLLILTESADDLDCAITANIVGKVTNSPLTMLATFPRSGNSYTRWIAESLSGLQTSSVYCDKQLKKTLKGECDRSLTWLVKTHYPVMGKENPNVKRALVLVRNPFDAILSFYHFKHPSKAASGTHHSRKGPDPTKEELLIYSQKQVRKLQGLFFLFVVVI